MNVHSAVNHPDSHGHTQRPLAVEVLADRCMGDISIASLLLDKFQRQLTLDVPDIERSLSDGGAAAVARTAHGLKGAAGAVAAEGVLAIAATIESLAQENRLVEVIAHMAVLRTEVERCMAFLPQARVELNAWGDKRETSA